MNSEALAEPVHSGSTKPRPVSRTWLRRGFGESDLESREVWVEEFFGKGLVAQGLKEQGGEEGQVGDGGDEGASGEQVQERVGGNWTSWRIRSTVSLRAALFELLPAGI